MAIAALTQVKALNLPGQARLNQIPHRESGLGEDTYIKDSVNQLVEGNKEAGATLFKALGVMAKNPWQTLKSFGSLLIEPFAHPVRAFERIKKAFKANDALEGSLYTALYVSTAVTTASFVVMGLALLAAPFTGGASLAIAAAASTVMIWTGVFDAGLTTAILAKDEFDLAMADTPEEYEQNVGQLADDYLNTFFAWVTLPMTDAVTAGTALPQGMAIAGRSMAKSAAGSAARNGLRAFRVAPRQQDR